MKYIVKKKLMSEKNNIRYMYVNIIILHNAGLFCRKTGENKFMIFCTYNMLFRIIV